METEEFFVVGYFCQPSLSQMRLESDSATQTSIGPNGYPNMMVICKSN